MTDTDKASCFVAFATIKKVNFTYVLIIFSTFIRSSSSVCSGVTIFLLKLTVVVKRFVETWKSID